MLGLFVRTSQAVAAVRLTLGFVCLLAPAPALGQECARERPTDTGASFGYGGQPAESYAADAGRFRVWYTSVGVHAPPGGGEDSSGVPGSVRLVAEVAEQAATFFEQTLGYRAPLGDGDYPACASNGGDGLLDVYLFDFAAADGTLGLDVCTQHDSVSTCSGFVILDSDFAAGAYATFEEGVKTVMPHELFHLVQAAYAAGIETWWSEATAQWATQLLYPELRDLESFLPAYFGDTDRPIDLPPMGAAQAFSYATAILPVYLGEAFEPSLVREVFDTLGAGAPSALDALEQTLAALGSELGSVFSEFAVFNSATGDLAGGAGYVHRERYPEVTLEPFGPEPGELNAALAGLSARYYRVEPTVPLELKLDADSERLAALFVPLVDGKSEIDAAESLPVSIDVPGVVVVVGLQTSKRDAEYTLRWLEPAGTDAVSAMNDAAAVNDAKKANTGCAIASGTPLEGSSNSLALVNLLFALGLHCRRALRTPLQEKS